MGSPFNGEAAVSPCSYFNSVGRLVSPASIIAQRAVTFVVISCKPDIAELAVIEVGEGLQGSSAMSPLLE